MRPRTRRLSASAAFLALALAGPPAVAGPLPNTSKGFLQAWHAALDDTRAPWRSFAGYGVDTSFGLGDQWWVVTFWRAHDQPAASTSPFAFFGPSNVRYVAKRVSGVGKGGPEQPPRVQWADSTKCAGFSDQLLRMESLKAPWIDVPGSGRAAGEPKTEQQAGADIHVWGRGASPVTRDNVMVDLNGGVNDPVGVWARDMDDVLRLCWSTQNPPGFR